MSSSHKKELQFSDYFNLIIDNKWLILFSILCFTAPTWYILSKEPDSYDAYSQIAIEETEETLFILSPNANKKNVGYYIGIFQGRAFQKTLVKALEKKTTIPGAKIEAKINFLTQHMGISEGTFNTFIKIKSRTDYAELSHILVQTATDSLITFCKNVGNQESQQAITAISEHIKKTGIAHQEVLKKKNETRQMSSTGDINGLIALQAEYEKQLVAYELKRAEVEAKTAFYNQLNKKVKPKKKKPNKKRLKLKEELTHLNIEKRKKNTLGIPISITDSLSIRIKQIETQIMLISRKESGEQVSLAVLKKWKQSKQDLTESKSSLQFMNNEIVAFKKAIEEFKSSHPNIINHELEISRLNEQLERYKDTHKRLSERLEDEMIKIQAQTGGLTLVEASSLPTEPIKKNNTVFYLLAVFVGALLGGLISILRSYMDDKIKSPDEIEKISLRPIIGTIPHIVVGRSDLLIQRKIDSNSKNNELSFRYPELILKGNEGIIPESYRSFRTNILFASPDKPIQTFIISSCGPHEGKSLTAANTALAFAQQGEPTLLIDADLRRPICHHLFHLNRSPGLGDLFSKTTYIDSVIQKIPDTSLDVMTAGLFLPNPAEVLGSKKFQLILAELKQKYKYIIFDTPPVIAVTDACILSNHTDGVVIVTRSNQTNSQALKRTVQSLEKVNANIIGCLLNDVNLAKNKGYYGSYKNYGQYYQTVKD